MPEARTNARIGYGTLFERLISTSPDVYQLLGERTTITGPGMSRDAPEATHMDSPEGWKEFLAGLKDGGEVQIEGNWVPEDPTLNSETGVLTEFAKWDRTWIRLTFPPAPNAASPGEAVYFRFEAILTGFEVTSPVGEPMTYSSTWKVSGPPELSN